MPGAPLTGADGRVRYEQFGATRYTPEGYPWICIQPLGSLVIGLPSTTPDLPADIDTVSFFSSYGPTPDSRIKPELVAPGEQVRLQWWRYTAAWVCVDRYL